MNLVKLYTSNGPMFIDTIQLANPTRKLLTIFTARGNLRECVGRTKEIRRNAQFGVHRNNLFATQELADANKERIFEKIFGSTAGAKHADIQQPAQG